MLDSNTQDRWLKHFYVVTIEPQAKDNMPTIIRQASLDKWENYSRHKKLERISTALYTIRGKFTHSSLRQASFGTRVSIIPEKREDALVQYAHGERLCDLLVDTIRHNLQKLISDEIAKGGNDRV